MFLLSEYSVKSFWLIKIFRFYYNKYFVYIIIFINVDYTQSLSKNLPSPIFRTKKNINVILKEEVFLSETYSKEKVLKFVDNKIVKRQTKLLIIHKISLLEYEFLKWLVFGKDVLEFIEKINCQLTETIFLSNVAKLIIIRNFFNTESIKLKTLNNSHG